MSDSTGNNFSADYQSRNQDFLLLSDSKISEEDRKDILEKIETIEEENKIPITDELFLLKPKKKGSLFPLLLNVLTILLVGGGILFAFQYFNRRQASLTMQTQQFMSTEGRLIEELKKETEAKLKEKEDQIKKIRAQMEELDKQTRDLQAGMEDRIKVREQELRKKLEEELAAERKRLQAEGFAQAEIEARMKAFEQQRKAEYDKQLEAYRRESEAALQEKSKELVQAKLMAQQILDQANQERNKLQEEAKNRESELRQKFEQEKQALESKTTEAEAKLKELSAQRDRESLINDQIAGAYNDIIAKIQVKDFEAARKGLSDLKSFLQNPAIQTLPSIMKRKNIDLFLIETLKETVETKAPAVSADTKSLLDAANLVVAARELVQQGDTAAESGLPDDAKRLYTKALEAIPSVNRAFKAIRGIEENQNAREIRGLVDEAQNNFQTGNTEDAAKQFRRAVLRSAGTNSSIAEDALSGLETILKNREQEEIGSRENTIEENRQRISELERTISKDRSDIAEYENTIFSLRKEINAAESKNSSLSGEVADKKQEIDTLKEQLARREQQTAALQARIDEMQKRVAAAESEAEKKAQEKPAPTAAETAAAVVPEEALNAAVLETREKAFNSVLDVIGLLNGTKPESIKDKIEEQSKADPLYSNIVEQIQELVKKDIGLDKSIQTLDLKLIGTISSVTAGRVVIEPLVNISVEKGAVIIIKRRTSSGEIPIAEGVVYDTASGRVSVRIEKRLSTTRNPIVMDLVYMEVKK